MIMSFRYIQTLTEKQVKELYELFQREWWTKGRQLVDVQRMVKHSDVIVGYCEPDTERLIAFARVITDFVFKALILDVIVHEDYRGTGLGRTLMNTLLQHPSFKDVKHFELYCRPEMRSFYQKWGFTDELGELHFMRRG
jgi:predicted GNAT family N-acyltransferase